MNPPEKVMKVPVIGSNRDDAPGDNSIHIESYSEKQRAVWNDFALSCEQSTFFHLIEWKELIETNFGHRAHYIMAFRNGKAAGILPLFEIKNMLFGHSLVSMPCVVYGGVCASDQETESALYRSAATLGRLMGVDYVEMRNQFRPLKGFSCLADNDHGMTDGFHSSYENDSGDWITKDLYVTFEKGIYPDNESNYKAIPRKQRRMIRQGMKAGLESKTGGKEFMEEFYDLYARNLKNHGTPVFSYDFFKGIMDIFPDTFILSVWKKNVMVAAVMTFVFKERIIPYYSGALREYQRYAVNDFLYWELMKYGCDNGYRVFDFGRSKRDTGSYDFKRHWGFTPETLPFLYNLVKSKEMPEVNPSNPKYTAMIKIWRKLPLSVTKWLGPKINRKIP